MSTAIRYALFTISFGLFYFIFNNESFAQLRIVPLNKQAYNTQTKSDIHARPMSDDPLTLPFWDDFSVLSKDGNGVPTGIPDIAKWQNSKSVWVNSGMGINPPSINVATFDGLDSLNLPYEASQILLNGFTDKLESRPIDLTSVPIAHKDDIYLRFFYQWGGNGEAPDPSDYMVVEFKDTSNTWITTLKIQFDQTPDPTVFYDTALHVTGEFFQDDFQFRFRRFGRKSGPFDTWNIDYVYLNYFMGNDLNSINDRTVSRTLSSPLGEYWAIPIQHYLGNQKKILTLPNFEATNLKDSIQPLNLATSVVIENYKQHILLSKQTQTIDPNFQLLPIQPLQRSSYTLSELFDTTLINTNADSVIITLKAQLDTKDNETDFYSRYGDIDFRINDVTSATNRLFDYYAYDDGTAEYSVVLNNTGNAAAIRYDMLVPKDTIIALDIYFPDFAVETNQTVDLYVYNDIDGQPGDVIGKRLKYTIVKNGLNNFSRVAFRAGVPVTNTFYIGWTELTDGKVKVGLDYSNDTDDKIFVRIGSTWLQGPDVHGSIMMRPVFGTPEDDITTGVTPEEENPFNISWYPNPNNGIFFVKGKYNQLQIINTTGQSIPYYAEDIGDEQKVTVQSSPGLYLIKIGNSKYTKTTKMIIK